jgi:hypothetical protein
MIFPIGAREWVLSLAMAREGKSPRQDRSIFHALQTPAVCVRPAFKLRIKSLIPWPLIDRHNMAQRDPTRPVLVFFCGVKHISAGIEMQRAVFCFEL